MSWTPFDEATPKGHIMAFGKPEDLVINGELLTTFDGALVCTATWNETAQRYIMDGGSRHGPFITPILWAEVPARPVPLTYAMTPRERAEDKAKFWDDVSEEELARLERSVVEDRQAAETASRVFILWPGEPKAPKAIRDDIREAAASAYFRSLAGDGEEVKG